MAHTPIRDWCKWLSTWDFTTSHEPDTTGNKVFQMTFPHFFLYFDVVFVSWWQKFYNSNSSDSLPKYSSLLRSPLPDNKSQDWPNQKAQSATEDDTRQGKGSLLRDIKKSNDILNKKKERKRKKKREKRAMGKNNDASFLPWQAETSAHPAVQHHIRSAKETLMCDFRVAGRCFEYIYMLVEKSTNIDALLCW